MDKHDVKRHIVLLHDASKELKEKEGLQLTDEEILLKNKLLEIEQKIDSVENALNALSQEKTNTIFSEQIFTTVVGTIAVAAATNLIAEYFNVSKEDLDETLF